MFWPQIIRGVAIMFCLLPPTRLALGLLEADDVADGSGLFNLMRNLGGAIGLALIDTVIFGRAPVHAARIIALLKRGDVATAQALGLPLQMFREGVAAGAPNPAVQAYLRPLVAHLSLVRAINEAWGLVALLTVAAMLSIPFARADQRTNPPQT